MIRMLVAILCLPLAGERSGAHEAAHESDRDEESVVALLRLQQMLAEIKQQQARLVVEFRNHEYHRPHTPLPREPLIGESAVIVIEKGGYATVSHSLAWNQYADDDLEVAVSASDASLVVPEKLVLDFEKHQFRFEYRVKAGDKAGEFTVTLAPKVGKPVVVKVLVK